MRRLIAFVLAFVLLLTACSEKMPERSVEKDYSGERDDDVIRDVETQKDNGNIDVSEKDHNGEIESSNENDETNDEAVVEPSDEVYCEDVILQEYYGPDDPLLIQHIEDEIYSDIVDEYITEDLIIDDLEVRYYSDEYLEHIEYNSKENVWFGYTLSEVNEFFGDEQYVFTLAENGETTVTSVQSYNSALGKAIKDVAVGTGVIAVCLVISNVVNEERISITFLEAAKDGAVNGVRNGVKAALYAALMAAKESGDFEGILEAAISEGAYEYKWSVIESVSKKLKIPVKRKVYDEEMPQWQMAKQRVIKKYGGTEGMAYKKGEEVGVYTLGAFRPDVVVLADGNIEAIDVAYYNLLNKHNVETMYKDIINQVQLGKDNLPVGATQRIVLDVSGRGYSKALVDRISDEIKKKTNDIYEDIPVDVIGGGI